MPRTIQRKNQKMFPGRPKKIRKCKISFKTILLFAPLEPNCRFDNKAANFPPQIRHFLAQSRKLFHKVNLMFLSKWFSGHVKFIFDNSVEKFRQSWKNLCSNSILIWKKKVFEKIIPQKVLRRLECIFDKTSKKITLLKVLLWTSKL